MGRRGRARALGGAAAAAAAAAAALGCAALLAGAHAGGWEERGKVYGSVKEASGLAASRLHPGILWTHNDSGDGRRIFALDAESGEVIGEFWVEGESGVRVDANDWEDLAVAPGPGGKSYLYIGDIGDNGARYDKKSVYRVEEPQNYPSGWGQKLRGAERFDFKFPDHAGKANSETLMVDPVTEDLFIVRKTGQHPMQVFRAKSPLEPNSLKTLEEYHTGCVDYSHQCKEDARNGATRGELVGGDISPSGLGLLVKSYDMMYYWRRPNHETSFFESEPRIVPYKQERQGETVAWAADESGYFTLSEGSGQVLYFYPFQTHKKYVKAAVRRHNPQNNQAGFELGTDTAQLVMSERSIEGQDAQAASLTGVKWGDQIFVNDCIDFAQSDKYTCKQRAEWGNCQEKWMQGFCDLSCGRCEVQEPPRLRPQLQPQPKETDPQEQATNPTTASGPKEETSTLWQSIIGPRGGSGSKGGKDDKPKNPRVRAHGKPRTQLDVSSWGDLVRAEASDKPVGPCDSVKGKYLGEELSSKFDVETAEKCCDECRSWSAWKGGKDTCTIWNYNAKTKTCVLKKRSCANKGRGKGKGQGCATPVLRDPSWLWNTEPDAEWESGVKPDDDMVLGVQDAPYTPAMDWDLLFYRVSQEQELANLYGPDRVECSQRVSAMVPERAIYYEADPCRNAETDSDLGLDPAAYGGAATDETSWLCQEVISSQGLMKEMCPVRECSAVRGSYNGLIVLETEFPSASHCCQACEHANPNKIYGYSCSSWSFCASPDGCGVGSPYGTCQLKASSEDPSLGLSWTYDPHEPWTSGEPPAAGR